MDLPEFRNRLGEELDTAFHPGTREGVLVILAHGVTGNKDRPLLVALADGLSARGWPCLRISFAGNGDSDLRDVLDSLPPALKVAYIGHSMGAAVGVTVAAEDPRIRVLVSLAGMVRTEEFLEREFADATPGKGFMWDEPEFPLSQRFADDLGAIGDLFDEVGQVSVPWLLIHGIADDVVMIQDSRDAYDTAEEPKKLVEIPGAGHSFDGKTYPQVVSEVGDWLAHHLG
jgi:fermentation-respiration switch protein FrsA (DUF1100 family)